MKIRKPKYAGELIEKVNMAKKNPMKKKRKISPLTGLKEGSKKDMAMDAKIARRLGVKKRKYGPSDTPKNAGKQKLYKKMCKKKHKHGPSC